jgi:spermidine synthase
VIFLDAYGPDSVPPHLSTQEFLQAVRGALLPGGVVVGNVWRRSHNPLYDAMVRTYEEVFDSLFIVNVEGNANTILLALPRAQRLSRSALVQRARQISAAKRFRFDLGALVDAGFADAPRKRGGGRVLRDADPGQPK